MDYPKISLGTCNFGGQQTAAESVKVLDAAYERGFRFLDTAEGYPTLMVPKNHGVTERIIGDWLKSRGHTDVIINTKVFGPGHIHRNGRTFLSPGEIRSALEGSIDRLGKEPECYMLHWVDPHPATIKNVVVTMGDLINKGKIKDWALSNASYESYEEHCVEAKKHEVPSPIFCQNHFAFGHDPAGVEQAPVPLMAYGVLRYGVYSGKYRGGEPKENCRLRWLRENFAYEGHGIMTDENAKMVFKMAKEQGKTPVQVAYEYVLEQPFTKNMIIAATSEAQLDDALSVPAVRDILQAKE